MPLRSARRARRRPARAAVRRSGRPSRPRGGRRPGPAGASAASHSTARPAPRARAPGACDRTRSPCRRSIPPLPESDPEIARLIAEENPLENDKIRLIASENYASRAVMEATGSVLTNKYSEGYAHKRYYEGQQAVDEVEELAIARAQGRSSAAGARQRAALLGQPGEPRRLPRVLPAGRHHHGPRPPRRRAPHARPQRLDHGQVLQERAVRRARRTTTASTWTRCATLAQEHQPKLLWCGTTAYPRTLDFPAFRVDRRRGRRDPRRRTSRTSRGSSRRACTPRRSASPTSSRRRRTRPSAARAAA